MEQILLKWDGKQCGVYCIKNLKNDKIYIGSSKDCYHRVRSQHFDKLQRGIHNNPHLQSSWKKYGKANFESFCVEICESSMLSDKEQGWIDKTNCLDPKIGYNINPYADRVELTSEQCKRVSLGKIGKPKRDGIPSGVKKQKNKGEDSWLVLLSFRNQDYYFGSFRDLKTAIDIRNYVLPRIISGQEFDWKWICSLRISHRKPVVQIGKAGEIVRYPSAAAAARDGFNAGNISSCCKGTLSSHGGFTWRYDSEGTS